MNSLPAHPGTGKSSRRISGVMYVPIVSAFYVNERTLEGPKDPFTPLRGHRFYLIPRVLFAGTRDVNTQGTPDIHDVFNNGRETQMEIRLSDLRFFHVGLDGTVKTVTVADQCPYRDLILNNPRIEKDATVLENLVRVP